MPLSSTISMDFGCPGIKYANSELIAKLEVSLVSINGSLSISFVKKREFLEYDPFNPIIVLDIGSSPISLKLYINDDQGWFDSQIIQLELNSGMRDIISFEGNVSSTEEGNPIHLNIIPDGHPNRSRILSFSGFTTPLTKIEKIQPESFRIGKPYPNPFNPSTRIEFSLDHEQDISLEVFGINGKLIETLIETRSFVGKHAINWNPKNIAAGIYFIRMTVEDQFKTEKVILLK